MISVFSIVTACARGLCDRTRALARPKRTRRRPISFQRCTTRFDMNSIPLEGYECYGKTPIPEPVSSNPALPPELREVLTPPTTWELWMYGGSVLAALQAAISFVTLSAFERIVLHYSKTGEVIPSWIANVSIVVAISGELIVAGVSGQIFEIHVRKLLFYKSLQFGVLIDYKNISFTKRYANIGGILGGLTFILSFVLMWAGYAFAEEQNFYEFLNVLVACGLIGMNVQKVIQPYLDCASLEDSLISLPKFLEKNPSDIKHFLSTCQVLPEQAVYARLCDLKNIQQEVFLREKVAFARSVGVDCSEPELIGQKIARLADKSHLTKFRELIWETARSTSISLSQLQDCGEEGKEIRGAIEGKLIQKAPFDVLFARRYKGIHDGALYEDGKFVYRIKNSSKDTDAILIGRYSSLFRNTYWVDDEINMFVNGDGSWRRPDLHTQFISMFLGLIAVALFSLLLSAAKLAELGQNGSA